MVKISTVFKNEDLCVEIFPDWNKAQYVITGHNY